MPDVAQLVEEGPYYVDERGALRFRYHEGQERLMESERRFILVLAGTQSGKTISTPWWLMHEIRRRGPGDYLYVTPTFPLLEKKALPAFKDLFKKRMGLGEYVGGARKVFTFSQRGAYRFFGDPDAETKVFFGHAQDPDSLESATAKAAVLDEAGQKKFKRESWEAIHRRLSVHEGRVLITTTPYTLGWLKSELHDPALKARRGEPGGDDDIELIQFESRMNPVFPEAEFERMRGKLPGWKFNMMYRGRFERPAGMIYDVFDEKEHVVPPFEMPRSWPRHLGLDFGGVNTAGVFLAEERGERGVPTGRYFVYRAYKRGGETASSHTAKLTEPEPMLPGAWGGAPSETQWRNEFRAAGLPVQRPPVSDVEVGIQRVYSLLKQDRLIFFEDLRNLIDELQRYSRVLDENDEPTEEIEDKNLFHRLDALRYVCAGITGESEDDWGLAKA